MDNILQLAAANQQKARQVVAQSGVMEAWRQLGMKVNLVGSLKTGLLMKHRDIDFHIYSECPRLADGLIAIRQMAANDRIMKLQYADLMDTEEKCLEYHAWYKDDENQLWQLDMIHIQSGSRYDGWFEMVADRIITILTPETRLIILKLKNETPETEKIMGIEYCRAVLEGDVRTYNEFMEWRTKHPAEANINWMP